MSLMLSAGHTDGWDYESMTLDSFLSPDWLVYLEDFYLSGQTTKLNFELEKFTQTAKRVGFRSGVKRIWEEYLEEQGNNTVLAGSELVTEFPGQDLQLRSGKWNCDESGIRATDYKFGEIVACKHPVMPIERIINVDSGSESVRLAFKRPDMKGWSKSVVVAKSVLASPQKIIELSDRGISVTSTNAKELIEYLQDIESMNYDLIPLTRSTARLGWISETEFSPYTSGLDFDEASALRRQYESVQQVGVYQTWLDTVIELRAKDPVYKILVAASFASPLMAIIDALPSFVHIWSSQSSTGKTIGLMVASSVWGDPNSGAYMQSFNSTTVAMERLAEFYNSMPLVLDEMQQARTDSGNRVFSPYKLAQGSGRARSNKQGGLERTPTWANIIITSGETPLVDQSDGAGALARVVNVELKHQLVDAGEGNDVARTLKQNYGHAGRRFIETIMQNYEPATIREIYDTLLKSLQLNSDIQDKQAMTAAALLTGDMLASEIIFHDTPLDADELTPHLLTRAETDVTGRVYAYIVDWVQENQTRFPGQSNIADYRGDIYGELTSDYAYIYPTTLRNALKAEGYNYDSVMSSLRDAGLLRTSKQKDKTYQFSKQINGKTSRVVAIKLPDYEVEDVESTWFQHGFNKYQQEL